MAKHYGLAAATVTAALAATLAATVVGPAAAQSSGRFQLERSGPNILRLDRDTGEIASCRHGAANWICDTLVDAEPEDSTSEELRRENERLAARIEVLERRLGRITAIANGRDDASETIADAKEPVFDAAKVRRDIDEAAEMTEYAVRRFRGLVDALTSGER